MKIYRIYSFDHRLSDHADESYHPEFFETSERAALDAMAAIVKSALEQPEDDPDEHQYPGEPIDQSPVECFIDKIELVDLPPLKLAVACLNRTGWAKTIDKQTVYIDARGTCRRVWPKTGSPSADNHETPNT